MFDRRDAGAGVLVRDGQRERSRARAEVDDHRLGEAVELLQHPAGQQLGLRPRHEDARTDGELELTERRAPGQVLQRHPVGALVDQGGEPPGRVLVDVVRR